MRLRNIPGADEAVGSSSLVIQNPKGQKGKWREVFGNDHPIHIEVGMGKGKFVTEMALRHPEINYVGIERYTSVLLRALQKREKADEIPNLYYLCIDACELPEIFALGEVGRIYLNFSDPWPKDRHAKRRLENFSDVTIRYWRKTEAWSLKQTTGDCLNLRWRRRRNPAGAWKPVRSTCTMKKR